MFTSLFLSFETLQYSTRCQNISLTRRTYRLNPHPSCIEIKFCKQNFSKRRGEERFQCYFSIFNSTRVSTPIQCFHTQFNKFSVIPFLSKMEESKDSEFSFIMGVCEIFFYYFKAHLINKQIVFQNYIAEKYNKKGGSKLCCNI